MKNLNWKVIKKEVGMSNEVKVLNMKIPAVIHKEIKVIAAEENKTMKDVVIKSIKQYRSNKSLKHQIYKLKYDAQEDNNEN